VWQDREASSTPILTPQIDMDGKDKAGELQLSVDSDNKEERMQARRNRIAARIAASKKYVDC
jgi:hypothetical protein